MPREFLDPGLVYDSDFDDWTDYLAGQGVTVGGDPISNTPIRASQLNLPSIAMNDMAARETVKRTVTNVSNKTSTYRASVTGLDGLTATVKPSSLTLSPGESGDFKVTVVRKSAPLEEYVHGNLFWKDGRHIVRSPIVVAPTAVEVAPEIPMAGRATVTTKSGFNGTMSHRVRGLVAGETADASAENSEGAGDPEFEGNYFQDVEITGPGEILRVQLHPDFPDTDDLDLYLLDADGNVVADSATGIAAEGFTTSGLAAGTYTIAVEAFAVHDGEGSTTFGVQTFELGNASAGNLTVAPASQDVKAAKSYTWRVRTSGLDPETSYLGAIMWKQVKKGPDAVIDRTLVSVR